MTTRPHPGDFELFHRLCSFPRCRAPIMWAKTNASARKEWMPLDAAPVSTGNVLAYPAPGDRRLLVCDVIDVRRNRARLRGMVADGWLLFQHHRLTCPDADKWARGPKAMRPRPTGIKAAPAPPDPPPPPAGLFDA